jgi:hypothetical protein
MSNEKKQSTEAAVREIRRRSRRKFSRPNDSTAFFFYRDKQPDGDVPLNTSLSDQGLLSGLPLNIATTAIGDDQAKEQRRPRLLSDNDPTYLSGELREWLRDRKMVHTRCALYHPQTQCKVEHCHESLDRVAPADVYFGRRNEVFTERSGIKRRTMERRKKEYLASKAA